MCVSGEKRNCKKYIFEKSKTTEKKKFESQSDKKKERKKDENERT